MSVPANTAARDDATMTVTVTGDGNCTDTGTVCIEPTGETTSFHSWVGPTARFESNLTPATADFNGRNVTENDAAGSHDDCWFVGSTQSKFEALTTGTWPVGAANRWGYDHLGWGGADITYYRANPVGAPSAPCSTFLSQDMSIDGTGCGVYTHNTLQITIGTATVSASRDGAASGAKVYP
jgi:hypothetical protein